LKRAAQDSLDWLWEWYWIQLDHAFGTIRTDDDSIEIEGPEAVREKLQTVLKTYVKERKTEIKTRRKDSRAGKHALSTYNLHYVPSSTSTPSSRTQNQLIRLLVDDKMILPTDKKLGSSMSGAFLIWNPLLLQPIVPISTLLTHMLNAMNTPSASRAMLATEMDPIREAMYEWALHVLRSNEWASLRPATLVEDTLMTCFSEPTYWNLRVAEALLGDEDAPNREQWVAVLGAAKADGGEDADVDMDGDVHVVEGEVEAMEQGLPVRQVQVLKEKIRGPRKVVGMWKPRPIGWVPEGWEDDE
jgi:ribosomal biogenesis protein LAS1